MDKRYVRGAHAPFAVMRAATVSAANGTKKRALPRTAGKWKEKYYS